MILKRRVQQRNGLHMMKMLCVSESQSNTVSSLASSKKSRQMSIQTGIEHTCQTDIQHSNNSILETAIADFFIAQTYLIVLLNWFSLNNFLKRLGMLVVTSRFLVGRILEVRL